MFSNKSKPSQGDQASNLKTFDSIVKAISECPKTGVVWSYHNPKYNPTFDEQTLRNMAYGYSGFLNFNLRPYKFNNEPGKVIMNDNMHLNYGYLVPKSKSVRKCTIKVFPPYDYRESYEIEPDVRSFPHVGDEAVSYVYTKPESFNYRGKYTDYKPLYHTYVKNLHEFPFADRIWSFMVYLPAALNGKVVADGVYLKSVAHNLVNARLIVFQDGASYALIKYYQPRNLEENERIYQLDALTVEVMTLDPVLEYDWHLPTGEVLPVSLELNSLTPIERSRFWKNEFEKIKSENEVYSILAKEDREYREKNREEIQRVEESIRRNKMPETNLGNEIAETLQKNNEFYKQLDRSTEQTLSNIDRMRTDKTNFSGTAANAKSANNDQQKRTESKTKIQNAVAKVAPQINSSNSQIEAYCAKIGKKSLYEDGRWKCDDAKAVESVVKPIETEERREAMAYCFETSNKRWLCHSPANKMTVSYATLAEAEQAGTCQYRLKAATQNGYGYFCNRPMEKFDQDVYEIYTLYGLAGVRRSYICNKDKSVSDCKAR